MLLTLLGNRRRILDAAQKADAQAHQKAWQEGLRKGWAEGWREGVEIGRQEGRREGVEIARREALQEMADWWYGYAKAEFAAGRDPGPPPTYDETSNHPD